MFHGGDGTLAMLLANFRKLKKTQKGEREKREETTERSRSACKLPEESKPAKATRFHGAHTREDPLTFFQYERDEQALRVGLREELSSRMQKYLRVLVKRLFMHV